MNSTRTLVVLALGVAALVAACGDDGSKPPYPDPPPQIKYTASYSLASGSLPSNEVTSFITTSEGELWIGTKAGLARFAGPNATQNEEVVNEINGLPHPQVTSMIEHAGKVYVGTWGGGLGVYNTVADTWSQIRPAATGLTEGNIAGLAVSETEGKIYLATNDGVFIYDTISFEHFSTVDDDLPEGDVDTPKLQQVVSSVEVIDTVGVVQRWYGPRVEVRISEANKQYHGIIVSKSATTYKYTAVNSGLVEPNVNDIFYDDVTRTVWVAYATKGVSQVNAGASTWTSYSLVQGLPSGTVYAIARAQNNEGTNSVIWAATQNGLAKLVGNRWESYDVAGGLPSSRVRSLYSDNGVRLWVGFVDAGAVRIK